MSNARERNLTQIYLCALFIIQPLLVHKTYLDIVETKREVFYALSALYLFFLFLLVLVRTLRAGKVLFPSLSWQEGFFLLFALCGITSSLLSPYARSAFLGNDNRNQGILAFSLYSMLLLSLRRYGAITPALRRCALLSASMVSILGILNQFHLDPLGFFTIIVSDQLPRFSSTIGNVDFYTAYLLLFFPVPLFLCLQSSTKKARLGYGLLALLFLYGIMAARTECGVLGLLVALSVTPLLCKEEALFRRFFSLLPLLLLAMLLYGTLTTALGGFRLSQLTRAFLSPLPLCLCYGLTLLLAYCTHRLSLERIERLMIIYRRCFFLLLSLCIIGIFCANLLWRKAVPASLAPYVLLTPQWGIDRGKIWLYMAKLFQSSPPLQKLLGGGSGCVLRWDMQNRLFADATIDAVHNEYLHYLLTHGLLGLSCYLAFLISSIRGGLIHGARENYGFVCACIAYAVQALVNIAQTLTTPLFFLLLFLLPQSPPAQEETKRNSALLPWGLVILSLCFGIVCTNTL